MPGAYPVVHIGDFRHGVNRFFLTYASDVQWVKNILASGSCSIETRGRVVELVEPELITDPELRPAPPLARFVERRIAGVHAVRADARFLTGRLARPFTHQDADPIGGQAGLLDGARVGA